MKDYKKILEGVVNIINTTEKSDIGFANICTYIGENCPELKESEGERIKEAIIAIIHLYYGEPLEDEAKEMIAWLEKQAQKPDKVEPKFKIGDWCIDNEDGTIFQIVKVLDSTYTYKTNEGKEYYCTHYSLENEARFWTIQDAKDGNVLHCWIDGDEFVLIYKGIKDGYITTYGHLYQKFKLFSEEPTTMFCRTIQGHFTPATKEQRDLLFQKMHESGYEWDAEKKELKKIEQNPVIEMKSAEESLGIDSDTYNKIVDECIFGEQKPAWSEEDENNISDLCSFVVESYRPEDANSLITWLKSIKYRVQPMPKQEWSEEDEKLYNDLSDTYFYNDEDYPEDTYKLMLKRVLDWMTKRAKSLRPQSHLEAE